MFSYIYRFVLIILFFPLVLNSQAVEDPEMGQAAKDPDMGQCEIKYNKTMACCWRIADGWINGIGLVTGAVATASITALTQMDIFHQGKIINNGNSTLPNYTQVKDNSYDTAFNVISIIGITSMSISTLCHYISVNSKNNIVKHEREKYAKLDKEFASLKKDKEQLEKENGLLRGKRNSDLTSETSKKPKNKPSNKSKTKVSSEEV